MKANDYLSESGRRRMIWPTIAVALLAGHATIIITAVCLAVGGSGRGVVPNYYQKAVEYDQHKAELAQSDHLGWRMETTVGSWVDANGYRRVEVSLSDARGVAVTGLAVHLELIQQATGLVTNLELQPDPTRPGVYVSVGELPDAGWYRLSATAEDVSRRFLCEQDIELRGSDQTTVAPLEGEV